MGKRKRKKQPDEPDWQPLRPWQKQQCVAPHGRYRLHVCDLNSRQHPVTHFFWDFGTVAEAIRASRRWCDDWRWLVTIYDDRGDWIEKVGRRSRQASIAMPVRDGRISC